MMVSIPARHATSAACSWSPYRRFQENAVTGDGAQRIINAVNIGYQLGVRIVTRVGGEQPLLIGQKQ
jgi:hypothetical protein